MLALTRRKNESVVIDGNIRVVVVDVRGDKVRLGIEAPADVAVFRSEVLAKIRKEESKRAVPAKIRVSQESVFAETVDFAERTLAQGAAARNFEQDDFAANVAAKKVKLYRRGKVVERQFGAQGAFGRDARPANVSTAGR